LYLASCAEAYAVQTCVLSHLDSHRRRGTAPASALGEAIVLSNSIDPVDSRRFAFGRNWARFLGVVDDARISRAETSLQDMLGTELRGLRFLDVGSGSGLFSLAARRLGAAVHSFDYDTDSVATTTALRNKYLPGDSAWVIEQGSVLDPNYLRRLGRFDIVYAWGVLHHTGRMWSALENVLLPLRPGAQLYIAIYNDQGWKSRFWSQIKKLYGSGGMGRPLVQVVFVPYFAARTVAKSLVTRRNEFANYKALRGMSIVHDWFDWLGGYPYEVASVEAIVQFYAKRGLELVKLKRTDSLGNNEFVFRSRTEVP
jgi:2-polyprenyl-3-methyl-5-hydroxy-6-metoxy-1,4-benzoquinol methylase